MSIITATPNTGIQLPAATLIAAANGPRSDRRDGGASALILRAPTTVATNNPVGGAKWARKSSRNHEAFVLGFDERQAELVSLPTRSSPRRSFRGANRTEET